MKFIEHDGGRSEAGFKGKTGDCVTRAIAIATGLPYQEVYDELFKRAKEYAQTHRNKYARSLQKNPSPRDGMHRCIYEPYLFERGFIWEATMGIGTGCTMHLRESELPSGILIATVSKHLTCVKYGTLYDTYDCSRGGTRCVYGMYRLLPDYE